jgi:aquaporin Z
LAEPTLGSKLVCEFLGTFMLVLTVGLNVMGNSPAGAFSIAASLMCMIYALGGVSGANFNPAVTLAILCCPKVKKPPMTMAAKMKEAALYMIAQILGGVVAGSTYVAIYNGKSFPLGPSSGFGWAEVTIAEILFTAVLCLVVLCVACSSATEDPNMFGFAIGSCITVGGFAIGGISGGSLNPAVSFGIASSQFWSPSVTMSRLGWEFLDALIYSVLEFGGAALAAGIVTVTHKACDPQDKVMPKPVPSISKLTAEFVGTFLLVLTVGCNVLSRTPVWAGVSIGSVLMVMIYAFAGVSGANFNPAVSITQGIMNTISPKDAQGNGAGMVWKDVGMYCGVQIVAGILAGFLYYAMFDQAFNLAPGKGFHWTSAGVCEFFYTFMLCFVVLNVTIAPNSYAGLAIGFVVIAGAYGAGAISGGCFNPAVAIGIDIIGGSNLGIGWAAFYVLFEIFGAVFACGLFRLIRRRIPGSSDYRLYQKLLSEFIGTFMLVLTVGLNVLASSPAAAFSIAASLMCMIYALGDVSGAHFNPAVTFAVLLCDSNPAAKIKESSLYMAVQILGGILAALTYIRIYGGQGFPLAPGIGFGWADAAVAEVVFTFVLCLVVLCVAVKGETKNPVFFGFAIGSCVTVGGFAIGKVSGGSLNPAVSIGIAMSQFMNGGLSKALVYSCLEFVGAGLAAGVVMLTQPGDNALKSKFRNIA